MEFLETFGCIWSSKEVIRVIFGRALPGATSRSDYMKSLWHISRSDLFRATQPGRSRGDDPGTTSSERHSQVAREETTQERPLAATCRGRSASICLAEFMFSKGLLVISLCTFLLFKTYVLSTFGSHQTDYLWILEKNNQKPLGKVYLLDSLDHMLFCWSLIYYMYFSTWLIWNPVWV